MKAKIFTIIILLLVTFGLADAQEPLLEILKVPAGAEPTIDGIMDDNDPWTEEAWIPMEIEVEGATTHDATSKFQILHNNELIFIIQQIEDNTPNNDPNDIPNTYERDNIEIFFHMDAEPTSDGEYIPSDAITVQLRFQRDGDGEAGLDATGAEVLANLQADDNFEWMVNGDDAGFIFEGAFPVATLNNLGEGPFNGTDFLFEIKYADNTTGTGGTPAGRSQQLYWLNADDNKYHDTRLFALVTLSETEISVNGTSISQVEVGAGSIYVTNNMLMFRNVEGSVSIYNIAGSLVKTNVIERNGSIDISSLNSGVYFVKTEAMTVKFVK
jgi:hypothetical protein